MGTVQAIFDLYREKGRLDYIGEPITQIEHMQQAAFLARSAKSRPELILGAFFHDIGHLCAKDDAAQMDGLGVLEHEKIGADFLRSNGLGGEVADLVELHVQAKRYLCFSKPNYHKRLSTASRGTLAFQGGVMSEEEAEHFENHPLFSDILRLRAWDEKAKKIDGQSISLEELERLALQYKEKIRCI